MRRVYKNLCPATTSASIMAANVWKSSLKDVESDNNKILYETLLDFFLQRYGSYCLNKRRTPNNIGRIHFILASVVKSICFPSTCIKHLYRFPEHRLSIL